METGSSSFSFLIFEHGIKAQYAPKCKLVRLMHRSFLPYLFHPIYEMHSHPIAHFADQNAQHGRRQHIAGKMNIEIQPGKGNQRCQRDGCITETAVGLRQDRRADDGGQRVSRGK